jgi:protein-S-isoprenylcysteine O-methyltransferase Ste14
MKKRIKIDSSLLSFIILLTGFLYAFPKLYSQSVFWDSFLDFMGMVVILKGNMLRMAARGHKKKYSNRSNELVTNGPYKICRNPMYFGSFLIGAGFILIVWPWWTLPIFAMLFYMRFKTQVVKEEKFLGEMFQDEYRKYCAKVPRIFPNLKMAATTKTREIIDLNEAFSTKETGGLFGWPILAVILESFQEMVIFGHTDIARTLVIFMAAVVTFTVAFIVSYNMK